MINKTRIFISSAYEEDLKTPRKMIKEHLERSGHEVPIFENGDFGTWEKDTLAQCIKIVRSSDVLALLINRRAGASGADLISGNVTPTYLEYKAAKSENKHILVFVSPVVKKNFMTMVPQLDRLYDAYVDDFNRPPDSPFDPFKDWIHSADVISKDLLKVADPFVWGFLYEIYKNRNWIYDFDFARTEEQAKNISAMLSTSLRTVVEFIPEREKFQKLEIHASYLLNYIDHNLDLINERNHIRRNEEEDWSTFLEEAIAFFIMPQQIVQAPDFNPTVVNTISSCFAASLYAFDKKGELHLIGATANITAEERFLLSESDVYVVEAFNRSVRLITFREDKQMLFITERIEETVLCLHFPLDSFWNEKQAKAYVNEIEYAIINQNDIYYELLKTLIGGRT